MSTNDVAVVRNGTRYEVWIGLRLLSTHSTIDAARTSARQITAEIEWDLRRQPRRTTRHDRHRIS